MTGLEMILFFMVVSLVVLGLVMVGLMLAAADALDMLPGLRRRKLRRRKVKR